jgi:DNA primase
VVASSGTSLGLEQIRSIKRQISHQQASTGQIVLNFDPDPAGARSTEKYISLLLAEGLRVRVLEIPGGLDPDEFIQQNGVEAYRKLLEKAATYFHWLADRARSRFDMRTGEGRMDAFKFIAPAIQQVHDRLERAAISGEMAEYLNVDRDVLRQVMGKNTAPTATHHAKELASAVPPNEKLLIACLLASADARATIRHYLASVNLLDLLELRTIFEAAINLPDGVPFSLEALSGDLEPRFQRILSEICFSDYGIREEDAAGQALYCLKALEKKAASAKCDALRRQVRLLEQAGNFQDALRLADELDSLRRQSRGR